MKLNLKVFFTTKLLEAFDVYYEHNVTAEQPLENSELGNPQTTSTVLPAPPPEPRTGLCSLPNTRLVEMVWNAP